MRIQRSTPLLVTDTIEPLLPLWRDQLGFVLLVQVPHGKHLGFVLLARDGQHVMLQTRESLVADLPEVAATRPTWILYTDVESLDAAMAAAKDVSLIAGPRTTFYGAREAYFRTPSGHIVAFAEPAAPASSPLSGKGG